VIRRIGPMPFRLSDLTIARDNPSPDLLGTVAEHIITNRAGLPEDGVDATPPSQGARHGKNRRSLREIALRPSRREGEDKPGTRIKVVNLFMRRAHAASADYCAGRSRDRGKPR
jgi:hypothetical protein